MGTRVSASLSPRPGTPRSEHRKAEILSIRTNGSGQTEYYIHFMEFNKRLDEWINIDRVDFSREVERPTKKRAKNNIKDVDTPSRIGSPLREGNRNVSATIGQKRKISTLEEVHTPGGTPTPSTPLIEPSMDGYESMDNNNLTPINVNSLNQAFSKEKEIERLRFSGSMTQSHSEISRLSKKEGKLGSPEKPLSDLGLLSYRSYWTEAIVEALLQAKENNEDISIEDISTRTSIAVTDVLQTLQTLDIIKPYKAQSSYCLTDGLITAYRKAKEKHHNRRIEENCLQWTPPHFTTNQLRFI
ncbi:14988_t:CDS:2 [Entrophospora sp. SA101]|nr:14988_t:CDS:2 [Entrophospora sp. SA101]